MKNRLDISAKDVVKWKSKKSMYRGSGADEYPEEPAGNDPGERQSPPNGSFGYKCFVGLKEIP